MNGTFDAGIKEKHMANSINLSSPLQCIGFNPCFRSSITFHIS